MSEQRSEEGSMLSDMCALLQSGEGADVTLVAGETELPAHSFVLALRSPVFAAMLRSDLPEVRSRRVDVADMREEVLKELLLFLYGDQTPQLASVAAELFAAAEKYSLPVLKHRCEQQLMRDISVENAAATAALAVQYSCPVLRRAAVEFVASHPEVMATAGWKKVLRDSAEVLEEICNQLALLPPRPQPSLPVEETQSSRNRMMSEELKQYLAAKLLEAARGGKVPEVRAVLTAGAEREARDGSGNTALHLAADSGHTGAVKLLMDMGLDVNAANSTKQTPLHVAAHRGHTDIMWMLVAASARVDAQDDQGRTPLHVAANKNINTGAQQHVQINKAAEVAKSAVGVLLLAGARKDIKDLSARTPETMATPATIPAFNLYGDL